jgi:hypothetical protein
VAHPEDAGRRPLSIAVPRRQSRHFRPEFLNRIGMTSPSLMPDTGMLRIAESALLA